MNTNYLTEREYDGSQLHHAFAYKNGGVLGPSISYFIGPCNVKEHLVDLEDSIANDFIKSERMVHFIIEIPEATIREAVVWQRLFIRMIAKNIEDANNWKVEIDGDDIMVDDKKLSVSIATLSRFSGLIHVGINSIVGEGCPVEAIGLSELNIIPTGNTDSMWMTGIASEFAEEYTDIVRATHKVIEV